MLFIDLETYRGAMSGPAPIQSQRVSEGMVWTGMINENGTGGMNPTVIQGQPPQPFAIGEPPPVFRSQTSAPDLFRLLFLLAGLIFGAYLGGKPR